MIHAQLSNRRIQILHPYPLVQHSLTTIMDATAGFVVVKAEGAVRVHPQCDILICDEETALRSVDARSRVRNSNRVRVVALGDGAREVDVRRALEAGVDGYLLLGDGLDEIVECVGVVVSGGRYICRAAARCMADAYGREELTRREQEVLNLLSEGLCNKHIARRMAIAEGTVKTHVKAVLGKLEARTRAHAVTVALQRGLVSERSLRMPPSFRNSVYT